MVEGQNIGIRHSFKVTEDKFATGNTKLVNHKKYYFVAIAYSYNEYKKYAQDVNNPDGLLGQQTPYLAGRKSALGPIRVVTAIPHIPTPEANGTVAHSVYGDGPQITRLDGRGNGGMELELTDATKEEILKNGKAEKLVYKNGYGPINIKVIDPLSVKSADYRLDFVLRDSSKTIDISTWMLYADGVLIDSSERSIAIGNEQLLLDLGLSISIGQVPYPGDAKAFQNGIISSSISYQDSSKRWLSGISDFDGSNVVAFNWIRSGTLEDRTTPTNNDYDPGAYLDSKEYYEKIVNGTWTAYRMASKYADGPAGTTTHNSYKLSILHSVDIVFTSDKSKWTRCPVVEAGDDGIASEGHRNKLLLRSHASVDKNGVYATATNVSTDPNDPNYIAPTGMGWFPGYAIDLETGERLNVMFGESSWLVGENGRDMLFNPTANWTTSLGDILFGGKHFVYVFRHSEETDGCPAYDHGSWLYTRLSDNNSFNPSAIKLMQIYREVMWCGIPMATAGQNWLSNEATVKIRVTVPYAKNMWKDAPLVNQLGLPSYGFTTKDIATETANNAVAKTALDLINIVPNPYFAYSDYEINQLDNRVKLVNLPENCTVKIYAVNGTLVRTLTKDNSMTSIDWDLKNQANIPIASGIYLIHITAPGIGERVIKWFGALRPVDLNAF